MDGSTCHDRYVTTPPLPSCRVPVLRHVNCLSRLIVSWLPPTIHPSVRPSVRQSLRPSTSCRPSYPPSHLAPISSARRLQKTSLPFVSDSPTEHSSRPLPTFSFSSLFPASRLHSFSCVEYLVIPSPQTLASTRYACLLTSPFQPGQDRRLEFVGFSRPPKTVTSTPSAPSTLPT
ncbi:hypothetical protein LX32DRAFT_914 [Colletotrichum zoysiae]|uniref:Uncharacterized protein n=1 Tax=Colletotrichum zoysiae TaxID=1216348 RepID=A0AAD9HUD7_9PEZI|nr:hypothetical protein LX32DRAFT_914 [Colletotrichum zoysiae]